MSKSNFDCVSLSNVGAGTGAGVEGKGGAIGLVASPHQELLGTGTGGTLQGYLKMKYNNNKYQFYTFIKKIYLLYEYG